MVLSDECAVFLKQRKYFSTGFNLYQMNQSKHKIHIELVSSLIFLSTFLHQAGSATMRGESKPHAVPMMTTNLDSKPLK